jgi:cytochrome c-type biogenesis protein
MSDPLTLALLAVPAGLIGFVAAPCCGLLAPAYLPFALPAETDAPAKERVDLPLVRPGTTISTVSSATMTQVSRPRFLRTYLVFMLGFCLFFTALGAAASTIGDLLLDRFSLLEKVAGVIVAVIGAALILRIRFFVPRTDRCMDSSRARSTLLGSFGMGFAMAVAWTPCTGATLGAILVLASTASTIWQGAGLLFLYSVGLGLPFGLMSLALNRVPPLLRFQRRHQRLLERIGGGVMVAVGVLILSGGWQSWLGPATSWLSSRGWPPI